VINSSRSIFLVFSTRTFCITQNTKIQKYNTKKDLVYMCDLNSRGIVSNNATASNTYNI